MKNKRTVSEEVKARVYNALLVGKENALNRDELVSKTGEKGKMKVVKKKILPEYFRVVRARKKNFEIRVDEDNVQVGDLLILEE